MTTVITMKKKKSRGGGGGIPGGNFVGGNYPGKVQQRESLMDRNFPGVLFLISKERSKKRIKNKKIIFLSKTTFKTIAGSYTVLYCYCTII